jgi:uncharacterized protein YecE (DUF72 family)
MASIRVGTSGYMYPAWRGRFYPADLPVSRQLAFASRAFQSIEINRSFYALLSPSACQAWRAVAPPGFVFALKGSRFITHNKKLREPEQALANFFAAGPLALGDMLGPIVWQLPASSKFEPERLEAFLQALPQSAGEAARLAERHDQRVKHGVHLYTDDAARPLRHVLEPRHESFLCEPCLALLRAHHVALAITDSPHWPYAEEPTTDFMYLRLHGSRRLYASQYTDAELARWASLVRAYQRGTLPRAARRIGTAPVPRVARDVYVYFDNDAQAFAAHDALRLIARLVRKSPAAARARETARAGGQRRAATSTTKSTSTSVRTGSRRARHAS